MNQEEWYVPQQENTEKIPSILQMIQQLQRGDPCEELAILYCKLGKQYQKIQYYEQAVNAFSTSLHNYQMIKKSGYEVSLVHLQLGRTYSSFNASEKAIQSLTLSLSLFESDPMYIIHELDAYNVLGVCYKKNEHFGKARECYQTAICKAITYKINKIAIAQPLTNLASINWAEGNIEEAIKCLLTARKIRNSNVLTQNLIRFYIISQQYQEGLTEILKHADNLLFFEDLDSSDYKDFLDRMFKNVLTAMKEVKDRAGRELIENILAKHYKEQDLLLDYIRDKLGRQKKKGNLMEELD